MIEGNIQGTHTDNKSAACIPRIKLQSTDKKLMHNYFIATH